MVDRSQQQDAQAGGARNAAPRWPAAPQGYALRLALPADAPALESLMRDYFAELGLAPDPGGLDADLAGAGRGYLRGGMVLLCRQGRAVGCVGLRELEPGVGEIKRMYLAPAHRGGGRGRLLLEAVLCLARERGMRRLFLDTRRDLEAANALYEAAGFRDTSDYNANPRAQRFMVLEL